MTDSVVSVGPVQAASATRDGAAADSLCRVSINRPVYDLTSFRETYKLSDDGQPVVTPADDRDSGGRCGGRCDRLTSAGLLSAVLRYLPVVTHLRQYRWRSYLVGDILAGLSGGVVHVPQVRM